MHNNVIRTNHFTDKHPNINKNFVKRSLKNLPEKRKRQYIKIQYK